MQLKMIVAMCRNRGIGYKNTIPWKIKKDMEYFAKLTIGNPKHKNALIMGKNTWLSLPHKPLPKRENLILSSTMEGNNIFKTSDECLEYCKDNNFDNVWVIGGQQIYSDFLYHKDLKTIYVTEIQRNYECDTVFPLIPDKFIKYPVSSYYFENNTNIMFDTYFTDQKMDCR